MSMSKNICAHYMCLFFIDISQRSSFRSQNENVCGPRVRGGALYRSCIEIRAARGRKNLH